MKRVFITGYSGFIGSALVDEILGRGYKVTGVSRENSLPEKPNLTQIKLDVLNKQAVTEFFAQNHFDSMIHLAWYVGPKCHMDNINMQYLEASLHLLAEFHKAGGKVFLANGTVSEYDFSYGYLSEKITPLKNASLHGITKSSLFAVAGAFCKQNGIDFKWARVFNLYGPKEKQSRLMPYVITTMLRGEDVKVSDCVKFQDYLHVEDTARGIADLFESNVQGAVNICSGTPVKLRTIVEKIAELTNFKGNILWGAIPSSFEDQVVVGNNEKLVKEVCWQQKLTLEEGLTKTITWWRNQNVQ